MTTALQIVSAGPGITVQDLGRPGWLSQGLSQGGAADRTALREGAALLSQPMDFAALELPGTPLTLRMTDSRWIALTGAPMRAEIDGAPMPWNSAGLLSAGATLVLRPTGRGIYSYVHVQGGLATPTVLGSRAAHAIANIGAALCAGDTIPLGPIPAGKFGGARKIIPESRFEGGVLRLLPTPQTALFPKDEQDRLVATPFTRDPRGNRQGVRLAQDGAGFQTVGQLTLLSDFIQPGDVQMTGDGTPYILGPECQTTGGYPRIGTVIPADLPRAMQAPAGALLRLCFVTHEQARAASANMRAPTPAPLVRDPRDMSDLLGYQLIDGMISAHTSDLKDGA